MLLLNSAAVEQHDTLALQSTYVCCAKYIREAFDGPHTI